MKRTNTTRNARATLTTFGKTILSINLLGVVFTALRLANITDWSWWIVLLPIWGPAAYVALTLAFCTIGLLAATILDHFDHLDHTHTKDNQGTSSSTTSSKTGPSKNSPASSSPS